MTSRRRRPSALAGVDGCRAGWIAAVETCDGSASFLVAAHFHDILAALPNDALLAVDMPIGLPDRIVGGGRVAEMAGRARLTGPRRSSIFPIPARSAVEAGAGPFATAEDRGAAYRESCRLARAASDPPRAPSIQSFGLFPRIMELDGLLRANASLAARVFESHPELAFAGLNGGSPLRYPKKRHGARCAEGEAERQTLLRRADLPPALLGERPKGAGEDDRLDACVLLLVARRLREGQAVSYPDPPGCDAHGLPVTIWV